MKTPHKARSDKVYGQVASCKHKGTRTFRAQDLSFLRTKGPIWETFVSKNFCSQELSFPGRVPPSQHYAPISSNLAPALSQGHTFYAVE